VKLDGARRKEYTELSAWLAKVEKIWDRNIGTNSRTY